MNKFIGTGVALITPFDENHQVDYIGLKKIVKFQINNGIDYLVILGTTGEAATLNKDERNKVIQTIIDVNNGILPLVLGIGGNNTNLVIETIKKTDLNKIDAILSVSPFYNKPTQEGIYQHFKAIASSTNKDIILYNVPHRTGKNVDPETIIRLANDCNNIVAVKDAASDIQQTFEIIKNKPNNFLVISGDDSLALSATLAGGDGVISVIGQGMPNEFSKMIKLGLEGNNKDAYEIHYKLMDLINLIFQEGNPAGIKGILKHKGICNTMLRLPLVEISDNLYQEIISELLLISRNN